MNTTSILNSIQSDAKLKWIDEVQVYTLMIIKDDKCYNANIPSVLEEQRALDTLIFKKIKLIKRNHLEASLSVQKRLSLYSRNVSKKQDHKHKRNKFNHQH